MNSTSRSNNGGDEILSAIHQADREFKKLTRVITDHPVIENPTTSAPKGDDYNWRKAASIHDFLADNPRLLQRYKEIGPAALLEL